MSLANGLRLGPYEIQSLIGAGGMGEVYKARDTRLDRTVAIKVLPSDIASDPERRSRFEREARAISSVTHPHICTLHDVGEQDGTPFLVMEYLEGKSLAERLANGRIALPQVLQIAMQIAEALAAAHKHGIVHRDLKPGNIMLTRSGVKLLDFGLAKWRGHGKEPTVASFMSAATRSAPLTAQGNIVGTVQYMAPEQIEGKGADARTDLFAFGAVVYEMVTGRPAFDGASVVTLMSAILEREPAPLATIEPLTPRALDRLVRKCLQKDPDARWQSAADVADELRWVASTPDVPSVVAPVAGFAHVGHRAAWRALAVVGVLVTVTVGGLLVRRPLSESQEPGPVSMRLAIALPPDMPLAPSGGVDRPAVALSRDERLLAYVALIGSTTQICMRDMRTGSTTTVAGTVGGHTPFFSPDGTWIGFFANGKLKKVRVIGGDPTDLAEAPFPSGGVWAAGDVIYFNRFEGEGIFRVAAGGGPVQVVAKGQALMPELGPRSRLLASTGGIVRLIDPSNQSALTLPIQGSRVRYLPSGHLVYASGSNLMVAPFDAGRLQLAGAPELLVGNLGRTAQFAVSERGTIVYVPGRPLSSFVWVDRSGTTQPLSGLTEDEYEPFALSPDGSRLAYGLRGEIFTYDVQRRTSSRLSPRTATGTPAYNKWPLWSPDGRFVIYDSRSPGTARRLVAQASDGGGEPVELWAASDRAGPPWLCPTSFSSDGRILSLTGPRASTSFDLFVMRVREAGGEGRVERFLATSFGEAGGKISPDGRWMLFGSDRSGVNEAYVTSFPVPGPIFRVSSAGAGDAMWNPALPEIVYMSGLTMYAVDVRHGPQRVGKPRRLFEGAYPELSGVAYAITRDGRFLMLESKEILKPTLTLEVITNVAAFGATRIP